jgi:hypothetical protein
VLVAMLLAAGPSLATPPTVYTGVRRVVAIGDIHGDFERFTEVLRLCQVTNAQGNWIAEKTHLVQTGDVLDRGPDSKKVMDLLMTLESQAEAAGGRVHALIGNHEYMTMQGDLRYVSDGELKVFGDGPRVTPIGQPPQGPLLRYRTAFRPTEKYGRWIAGHNAVVKINDTLFMHGGLGPRYLNRDLQQVNDFIRAELLGSRDATTGVGADPEGPLWFRGLAESLQEQVLTRYLTALAGAQKAQRIVMGHTIQEKGISLQAGGRLALIDVGMSKATLGAPPTCLVLDWAKGPAELHIVRP